METIIIDPLFGLTSRIFLGLFFLAAAFHKARGRHAFVAALRGYALFPHALLSLAAIMLLASEFVVGALLLIPEFATYAGAGALVLLALYFAAIATNLLRGRRNIDCGCSFGSRASLLSGWHLIRIGGLMLLAILPLMGTGTRELVAFDMLNLGGMLIALAVLYGAVDALLANHGRIIEGAFADA